jgi:hypothetical protein
MYVFLVPRVIYIWAVITDNSKPATKPAKDIHLYHNEDHY